MGKVVNEKLQNQDANATKVVSKDPIHVNSKIDVNKKNSSASSSIFVRREEWY